MSNLGLDDFLHRRGGGVRARKELLSLPREPIEPIELLSDTGNARRLNRFFGALFRFVMGQGFYVLDTDTKRWRPDSLALCMTRLAQDATARFGDMARTVNDEQLSEAMTKWARQSESSPAINRTLELVKAVPDVAIDGSLLNADKMSLAVQNGVIDLRTGGFRPTRADDFMTFAAGTYYDAEACCPKWEEFIRQVCCGDKELFRYMQRLLGYLLTGDISERAVFYFYGSGANGKSVLLGLLARLLGEYSANADAEAFAVASGRSIRNDLARLEGKRLVTVSEVEPGQHVAVGLIKRFSGGDPITARKLYEESREYIPVGKLIVATNHLPVARDDSSGFWDRMRVIPFNYRVPHEQQNKNLMAELLAELPGILNWMLEGLSQWHKQGLGDCVAVRNASRAYRDSSDQLASWIKDACNEGKELATPLAVLYQRYLDWCEVNRERPWRKNQFAQRLRQHDYDLHETRRQGLKAMYVIGLAPAPLRVSADPSTSR